MATTISTHVWYGDKCWFVSTIERSSSIIECSGNYNETAVFEYNSQTKECGALIWTDSSVVGCIKAHITVVENLHTYGVPELTCGTCLHREGEECGLCGREVFEDSEACGEFTS